MAGAAGTAAAAAFTAGLTVFVALAIATFKVVAFATVAFEIVAAVATAFTALRGAPAETRVATFAAGLAGAFATARARALVFVDFATAAMRRPDLVAADARCREAAAVARAEAPRAVLLRLPAFAVARAAFVVALAAGRFALVLALRAVLPDRDALPARATGAALRFVEVAARFGETLAAALAVGFALLRFDDPVAPAALLRADLGGFFADVIRRHSSIALLWRQGAADSAGRRRRCFAPPWTRRLEAQT